jgi:type I restriction enzyme M protein
VIRTLSTGIGEQLTTQIRAIADANPLLKGIIDRIDFNATTHGVRDLDDDRLSNLIEAISAKRLGLDDVEPDLIGRSYEYLIRKFAEGSVSSAGEFYTPKEVGFVIARILEPAPGMDVYDPCCGSAGLLIKCQLVAEEIRANGSGNSDGPLRLHGQEYVGETWAMANMNMIIHDMEGSIELGDTFKNPRFRKGNRLQRFDRVVANPMWNQDWWRGEDYDADEFSRFPRDAGYPGRSADWGWLQIIQASLNDNGRAAVILDTGAASRGSAGKNKSNERRVRQWFIDRDLVETVVELPENLFYNTPAQGIIVVLNSKKTGARKDKFLLINASQDFAKGDPKNFLPESAIDRVVAVSAKWQKVDHYSTIIDAAALASSGYNLLPSRYIRPAAPADDQRSVVELARELRDVDAQIETADEAVRAVLAELGADEA